MKRLALAFVIIATSVARPLPAPAATAVRALAENSWAEVKLPYRELTALWQSTQEQNQTETETPDPPPIDAIVTAAEYELNITSNATELVAHYRLSKLTDTWAEIPLLGGDARLDSQATNTHTVAWRKSGYALLTRESGDLETRMIFALPQLAEWQDGLHLIPGAASLNRLRITGLAADRTVRIANLKPSHRSAGELVFHFPGTGGEFILTTEEYEAPKPPAPLEPSEWGLQSEVLTRYVDGRIHHDCLLYATARNGSGVGLDILLPRNAGSIAFSGDDAMTGRVTASTETHRLLQLRWATRDIVDRRIELSYSIAQSPLDPQWTLRPPRLADGDETKSLFAIQQVNGLELVAEALRRSVESRSLPEWLREKIGAAEFLTLEATGEPSLTANWLPQIKTAQAIVREAEYQTRLVADGSMLVSASCTIGHEDPLNWRLEMPDYDEILSCEVNGQRVRPIDRQDDGLEFPLSADAKHESRITFTYVAKTAGFDPVSGRLDLELPKTELFVHSLKWQLAIPDRFETTAIEGNVELDPAAGKSGEIRLIKQLLRQEHPAVELHYQRHGLND